MVHRGQLESDMKKRQLVIGVDGGGSKSAGVAAGLDGKVLGFFRGKGINYYQIGMDRARQNLADVVRALEESCQGECAALSVGMPALDTTADRETLCRFAGNAFNPKTLWMESDAYMALMGVTHGGPGMIVICGTGSMALLTDESGGQRIAGGWGYLLGDPGSGCAIAMDGLRAAVAAWEKTGPDTLLAASALAFFSLSSPRALIERIYAPDHGPDAVARFAPAVFSAAEAGDEAARRVVETNMEGIAGQAAFLLENAPDTVQIGLYGGIFQHQAMARQMFSKALTARAKKRTLHIALAKDPPELGALIHYFKRQGTLDERLLRTLLQSFHAARQGKEE